MKKATREDAEKNIVRAKQLELKEKEEHNKIINDCYKEKINHIIERVNFSLLYGEHTNTVERFIFNYGKKGLKELKKILNNNFPFLNFNIIQTNGYIQVYWKLRKKDRKIYE